MTAAWVLTLALGLAINFYQMIKTNEYKTKIVHLSGR